MISQKTIATLLLAAAWVLLCTERLSSERPRFRGGEASEQRRLQEMAGIEFSTGYIVGGSTVSSGTYPWFTHFGSGVCGGVLVAGNRVLTAGECIGVHNGLTE